MDLPGERDPQPTGWAQGGAATRSFDLRQLTLQAEALRAPLIRILIYLIISTLVCTLIWQRIFALLHRPLGRPLAIFFITEAFMAAIKTSLAGGIVLSSPLIFFEILNGCRRFALFVSKKRLILLTAVATLLFLSGVVLCYVVVLPAGVGFLMGYGGPALEPMISLDRYLSLILGLLLAFGLIFELPLVMVVLGRLGVIDARTLSAHRKYAILAIAIASAILTPTPDAYNMMLMLVPLMLLYEISILAVRLLGKGRRVEG